MTSHGFLNYSSRLWSHILLLPWWNNLNSNQAARSECQGTPVLLEMKLHYMMGKLVTWGGRQETLLSPWRTLTDHGQGLIQVSDTYFTSNIFSTSYLLATDLGWWRRDPPALMFPYWQFLGSTVCLREIVLFSQLFWYNRHLISKTSVTVQCRHQIQELLGKLPLCSPWPYYKALTGPGQGSLQMENSTDPQKSYFSMGQAKPNFLLISYSSIRALGADTCWASKVKKYQCSFPCLCSQIEKEAF